MIEIDINCDVGEGLTNEAHLFAYISSCNIACGGHYGTIETIDQTIQRAMQNNVLIGAHPSYPDAENFGRKILAIADETLQESITNQLNLIVERLSKFNQKLHHIKPHGALYNELAKNKRLATLFVSIVKKYDDSCLLYVPYNSVIEKVALEHKIKIKYEAFADRNYHEDLSLVSRSEKKALIVHPEEVFKHVLSMVKSKKVMTRSGSYTAIKAATFCVHGDHPKAIEILKFLGMKLTENGIKIV
jgi:UPF0271 protein